MSIKQIYSLIISKVLYQKTDLFIRTFHICKLNIISQGFHHLYKSLVYNTVWLLYYPIHIGFRGAYIFSYLCLCGTFLDAFYFHVKLDIILKHGKHPIATCNTI